ncbi:MAG: extracellular solute-binding protein [Chloroflexi bacterium]|nr:extracellular solute-binding protein [Chloroflexota bacterium]
MASRVDRDASSGGGPAETQSPGASIPTGASPGGDGQIGGQVNVWTAWGGAELAAFQAVLEPFIQETGIQVNLLTIRDQDLQLSNNVEAGTSLPDIANPPNPQRYAEWAQQGIMKPLEDFIDMDYYLENTVPGLLLEDPNYGFIDGQHYLLMVKSQLKGLIWYNPKVYTGEAPETWDDLNAIEPPEGTSLWCAAFESGDASGWPASDDLANIVMRQSGAQVYVDWYEGRHPWTSPEIRQAYETFGEMVAPDGVFGGTNTVLTTNFGNAGDPLFTDPPGCLFMEQATFMTSFFEENTPGVVAGEDYNFFPHPSFNDEHAGNVEGFFDTFVMYNDTPQARALMNYMVTQEAQQIWVDQGGTLAANKNITEYPNVIFESAAEVVTGAENILLTAGDYMPADMQRAFWKSLLDFTNDQSQLDAILGNLDQVQAASYTE